MSAQVKCPHCKQQTAWEGNPFRPFCTERCKLQDLGSWAMGKYAIPSEHSPLEDSFSHTSNDESESS